MRFELDTIHHQQSNMGSDVSNLVFHGDIPTYAEFVDFIAKNSTSEWGEISVVKNCRLILKDNLDRVEYSYGKLLNRPKEEYANRKIKNGTCWSSWCAYDYYLELEDEQPEKEESEQSKPYANAMDNDMMQRMEQKVIDSMPEDSPLLPLIKDGKDAVMVYILLALLFLPTEEMKRIAQEMMREIKEAET